MPQSVTLFVDPANLEVRAGAQATARLIVRNNGDDVGQYLLRASGGQPGWVKIEPNQLGVFPGEQANASVRVSPSAHAPAAAFSVVLSAIDQMSQGSQIQTTLYLTVRATGMAAPETAAPPAKVAGGLTRLPVSPTEMGQPSAPVETAVRAVSPGGGRLELLAERGDVTLLAGARQRVGLTLRNTSGAPLAVELAVRGLPGVWLNLMPNTLTLPPGGAAPSALTLMPPAGIPPSNYPFTLIAQARDDPNLAARLNLVLEIGEPGQVTLDLTPAQAEGQANAGFQVRVSQSGAALARFRLSAIGDEACDFVFDPETIAVPPAGTATSRLSVRARQGLAGSDTKAYPFTVSATSLEGISAPATAAGHFVQRRAPSLQAQMNPPQQRGAGPVAFALTLTNPSQLPAALRLTASDPENACRYDFAPASVSLKPGATAQATLHVTPLSYGVGAGEALRTFTVCIESADAHHAPSQIVGRFVQTPAQPPELSLRPTSQTSAGAATFALQVRNPRATSLTLDLRQRATAGYVEVSCTPYRLQIAPGATVAVRVVARPTEKLLPGESRRVCTFTIEASAEDMAEPAAAEGSLIQVRSSGFLR